MTEQTLAERSHDGRIEQGILAVVAIGSPAGDLKTISRYWKSGMVLHSYHSYLPATTGTWCFCQ
ncbi:hypothetical protein [Ghiorsea bivora]|uniref:hypothetical protein n=1 Tax=Ghiorsea bivora TaxID=1485545 RepID=UPI0012FD8C8F|nr:hypothetical protein [Ghiorsea bivora]